MTVALAIVGVFLALDACVTLLMLALWTLHGHVPDFLAFTAFGLWSIAMVMMAAGVRAGSGVLDVKVWGTVALSAAMLALVAVPAAGEAFKAKAPVVPPRPPTGRGGS